MNAKQVADAPEIKRPMLLVLDATGQIQAVSPETSDEMAGAIPVQKHYSEVFGADSEITRWLTEHFNQLQNRNDYVAHSNLQNENISVQVRLASLKSQGGLFGFVLEVAPGSATSSGNLRDGDAIVVREQWHDIKNQVGALKLYATYLMRKMAEGEDRQTVEKMLNGINTLIDYIAKIRRGDAQ